MSWKYSDKEYIKIFRKMLNWEWYTDINTKVLFLHCLLKANWKDGAWHGHTYKRGQFITSLPSLSKETGLSIQQVRTALSKLQSSNEIKVKTSNQYSIITVCSYMNYQNKNQNINRNTKICGFKKPNKNLSLSRTYTDELENLYANDN